MDNLNAVSKRELMPVNPLIKKLKSLDKGDGDVASYGGIYKKCLFFAVMTLIGVAIAAFFRSTDVIFVDKAADVLLVENFAIWMILAAAAIFLIFPFLAFIVRVTIPVTGSLYCVAVGYLFGFVAVLDDEMGSYIVLALMLTLAVVAVMGFLFSKGIVRVSAKMRAVTTASFFAMVVGGGLLFVASLVPAFRGCVMQLRSNPVLYILGSVGGIVIAVMFLLVDFDNIRQVVEDRLPKKYEWYASYSLIFTVVWIYIKVLDLVLKLKDR